ncbi:MAG TPA: hypothetical protein VFV37_00280 [Luteibaculaceae bacterium]|nr:hypothetical protein [Luteibaculaceae bacterium]
MRNTWPDSFLVVAFGSQAVVAVDCGWESLFTSASNALFWSVLMVYHAHRWYKLGRGFYPDQLNHQRFHLLVALTSTLLALATGFKWFVNHPVWVLFPVLWVLLYTIGKPGLISGRQLWWFKNFAVATGWTYACSLLPIIDSIDSLDEIQGATLAVRWIFFFCLGGLTDFKDFASAHPEEHSLVRQWGLAPARWVYAAAVIASIPLISLHPDRHWQYTAWFSTTGILISIFLTRPGFPMAYFRWWIDGQLLWAGLFYTVMLYC